MANSFGTDILIQVQDPKKAALFYVKHLGFEITGEKPNMISLHGEHINLFIERGAALGPVLEVTVDSVEKAKLRLLIILRPLSACCTRSFRRLDQQEKMRPPRSGMILECYKHASQIGSWREAG